MDIIVFSVKQAVRKRKKRRSQKQNPEWVSNSPKKEKERKKNLYRVAIVSTTVVDRNLEL